MNQERIERLEVGCRIKYRGVTCSSYKSFILGVAVYKDRIVSKNRFTNAGPSFLEWNSSQDVDHGVNQGSTTVNSFLIGICLGSIGRLAEALDLSKKELAPW